MGKMLKSIYINKVKGFKEEQKINLSRINLFIGANSGGKSTVIQTLLMIKQTIESQKGQFDLLVNGKYATLGGYNEVHNKNSDDSFEIGLAIGEDKNELSDSDEINELDMSYCYKWKFVKSKEKINSISMKELHMECDAQVFNFVHDGNLSNTLINIDEKSEIKEIQINNLKPSELFIEYDKRYDRIMHDFLWSIYDCYSKDKKFTKWNKSEPYYKEYRRIGMAFYDLVSDIVESPPIYFTNNINSNIFKNASNLYKRLNERLKMNDDFDIIASSLTTLFSHDLTESENKIDDIIQKTQETIEKIEFKAPRKSNLAYRYDKLVKTPWRRSAVHSECAADLIAGANKSLDNICEKIKYLGPIREKPRSIYEFEADQDATYVGKDGQNLPGILTYYRNNYIHTILPDDDEVKRIKFSDALDTWIKYLEIGEKIYSEASETLCISVSDHEIESNLINVGVGVSQVLPVIAMGLLSQAGDILIYEQPELHLHPAVQSKLIDFFIAMSKLERQIILETHSEYFLHRLRYKLLDGQIGSDEINLLFFSKHNNGTKVTLSKIGEFGEFDYPEGFKDETDELINQLLKKQIQRLKNE